MPGSTAAQRNWAAKVMIKESAKTQQSLERSDTLPTKFWDHRKLMKLVETRRPLERCTLLCLRAGPDPITKGFADPKSHVQSWDIPTPKARCCCPCTQEGERTIQEWTQRDYRLCQYVVLRCAKWIKLHLYTYIAYIYNIHILAPVHHGTGTATATSCIWNSTVLPSWQMYYIYKL